MLLLAYCGRHRRRLPLFTSYLTHLTSCTVRSMATTSHSMAISSHYQAHSAETYEQAYFSEAGDYQNYLMGLVQEKLQLQLQLDDNDSTKRRILDIGGGTGNFAQALVQDHPSTHVTVVDPFLDPTTSNIGSDQVSFAKAPAEAFLTSKESSNNTPEDDDDDDNNDWRNQPFHQVMLKEVVHHLEDRVGIFRGMRNDVTAFLPSTTTTVTTTSIPSLLIMTRPQTEIDYPLWDAARDVWKKNQPSVDDLCTELRQAGFTDIQHSVEPYPCSIALSRWQSMVQNRFWSTFSNFSDEELLVACEQIANDYQDRVDDQGILRFEDRLICITACKER
jgi:2-polyprenyl-3-methyl-5-hydroxy-6-metoxy-1,4-benzoquinol methylase